MKNTLLSLNSYYYRRGGAEAVFFDHQKLFQNINWNTIPFAMHHAKNEPSEWDNYFADELEFGNNYTLPQKILMASKVIYSWEAKAKLKKIIQHTRPDIAHAHNIYHHLSPSVLSLLKEESIPTVMTAHDLKLACPAYKMLNKTGICEKCNQGSLFNVVKNRCVHNSLITSSLVAIESTIHKKLGLYKNNLDMIITPSQFYRDKLIEWGWDPSKLVYIPNFIRYETYTPNFNAGNYFLYFGRLAPEKGVDTLIKAAVKTGVNLKIAGTGPDEKILRQMIPNDSKTIEFLGFCSGKSLHLLIQQARAVILPSQWYENAPISMLEAYASGKPIIGARIGGIPEMIRSEETGLLFESGNIEGLAEKISTFQNMPNSQLVAMGKSARHLVSTTFTVDRYLESICQLYKSLGVKFYHAELHQ